MARDRIKSLSKKVDNAFPTIVPIGVDGGFVDMRSGQSLEEELCLTGPRVTTIGQNETTKETEITTEYRKATQTNDFYRIITVFGFTDEESKITETLYYIDESGTQSEIRTKVTVFESTDTGMIITED